MRVGQDAVIREITERVSLIRGARRIVVRAARRRYDGAEEEVEREPHQSEEEESIPHQSVDDEDMEDVENASSSRIEYI